MSKSIDEALNSFGTDCSFRNLSGNKYRIELDQTKQAIYDLLAKEVKYLIMSDGIRREAVPLSKIKEMFNVED